MSDSDIRPVDAAMADVVNGVSQAVIEITNQSVKEILGLSAQFMTDTSQKALQDFHRLYFSNDELSAKKEDVNADVDHLFEEIQQTLAKGEDPNAIVEENESKTVRLSLAAVQKQLESILQLDLGMRQKLVPAIMSLRFEETTRQHLSHIALLWKLVSEQAQNPIDDQRAVINEAMKTALATHIEKKLFYSLVLKENLPEDDTTDDTWLNSLL
jgi:hypothetical protein